MLKLNTVVTEQDFIRHIEEYVPLRIEFQPAISSIEEIYYWRNTNNKYLVEIKIDARNGGMAEFSLILVPSNWVLLEPSIKNVCSVPVKNKGLPTFDLSPWTEKLNSKEIGIDPGQRYIDENSKFRFIVADDGVAIMFENQIPHYKIINKKISFCFNKSDELCGVILEDLDVREFELLKLWEEGFQ